MKFILIAVWSAIMGIFIPTPSISQSVPKDVPARIEAVPVQTLTLSDEQFLKGDAYGIPTTIAGVLHIAQGSGRLPLVVFIAGSGGLGPVTEVWDRQLEELGISTFAMDSFAASEGTIRPAATDFVRNFSREISHFGNWRANCGSPGGGNKCCIGRWCF